MFFLLFSLLPIAALALVFLVIKQVQMGWRKSLLDACLVWGVILTIITEVLSIFNLFGLGAVAFVWLLVDAFLIALYIRGRSQAKYNPFELLQKIPHSLRQPVTCNLQILGILLTVFGIGIVAFVAAPNHSDSMEYHLPRVVHWIQNNSVAHYPTHEIFQLYQNPWSEFAIAHFQILTQSDRLAASIQWFAMLASILGVSLIAKELGANWQGQILSAVFCTTIPMGILQGSSTNNDLVVAFWMVCLAYFTLLTLRQGAHSLNIARLGASLGLAILTKGTAYIYAFPFCLWLALWGINRYRLKVWQPIVSVSAIAILLNFGHYVRNFLVFGSPLGVPGEETIDTFGPKLLISNVLKQLALHADFVRYLRLDGLINPMTGIAEKVIRIIHNVLGVDINNPALMSSSYSEFFVPGISFNEDTAGNPVHLIIIFLALGLIAINFRLPKRPLLFAYALVVTGCFLLFCALLTWSLPRCRLHLPIFILYAGLVGPVLAHSLNRRVANIAAILLIAFSSPWIVQNSVRPIWGENSIFEVSRAEQYFTTQTDRMELYMASADIVRSSGCQQVGLDFKNTSFEYPFWVLVDGNQSSKIIRHVNVQNESAFLSQRSPFREFQPCQIVYFSSQSAEESLEKTKKIEEVSYEQDWSQSKVQGNKKESVQIFTRKTETNE
jgi:4-amino-4-deoxy-L-arabinose transferase-like glycosyltransferase